MGSSRIFRFLFKEQLQALEREERRLQRLEKTLQGETPPGRAVTVYPDDIFIVSYPKSGNTWARFLIGNARSRGNWVDFEGIERVIPDIYQTLDIEMASMPRPRVLKSHEYFDPRYGRVIYIVRDPRDVVVSYFHHQKKKRVIDEDYEIEPFVDRLLDGEWSPYGSWQENVESWIATRGQRDDFLLVSYEAMLEEPRAELERMLRFLDIELSEELVDESVRRSSAKSMRDLEIHQSDKWRAMAGTRADMTFVRKAEKGGWMQELPGRSVRKVELAWGGTMKRLGYTLSG
jgi:hypothetical protein